jgi:hypothetical protein
MYPTFGSGKPNITSAIFTIIAIAIVLVILHRISSYFSHENMTPLNREKKEVSDCNKDKDQLNQNLSKCKDVSKELEHNYIALKQDYNTEKQNYNILKQEYNVSAHDNEQKFHAFQQEHDAMEEKLRHEIMQYAQEHGIDSETMKQMIIKSRNDNDHNKLVNNELKNEIAHYMQEHNYDSELNKRNLLAIAKQRNSFDNDNKHHLLIESELKEQLAQYAQEHHMDSEALNKSNKFVQLWSDIHKNDAKMMGEQQVTLEHQRAEERLLRTDLDYSHRVLGEHQLFEQEQGTRIKNLEHKMEEIITAINSQKL